jgi:hypothetical protein
MRWMAELLTHCLVASCGSEGSTAAGLWKIPFEGRFRVVKDF